jgi:hypothetical protein
VVKIGADLASIWVFLASFLLSESDGSGEILGRRVRPGLCFSARSGLEVARFVSKKSVFVLFLVGVVSGGVSILGRNPKAESHYAGEFGIEIGQEVEKSGVFCLFFASVLAGTRIER